MPFWKGVGIIVTAFLAIIVICYAAFQGWLLYRSYEQAQLKDAIEQFDADVAAGGRLERKTKPPPIPDRPWMPAPRP